MASSKNSDYLEVKSDSVANYIVDNLSERASSVLKESQTSPYWKVSNVLA